MNRPEPILPEAERTILLDVYENPARLSDTFYFTDKMHFADATNLGQLRMTPEYTPKFKETVRTIESLVEAGLIDGRQLQHRDLGMYYADLKVRFKGKQVAIREKRRAEEIEKLMPELAERSNKVIAEMQQAEEKKQGPDTTSSQ